MRKLSSIFIHIILVMITIASCQKVNDKNVVNFSFESGNYSYKNYNIKASERGEPKMHFEVGDTLLALYSPRGSSHVYLDSVLVIMDTVYSYYDPYKPDIHLALLGEIVVRPENLNEIFILEGFKSYNYNYMSENEKITYNNRELALKNMMAYDKDRTNFTVRVSLGDCIYKVTTWINPNIYYEVEDSPQVKLKYTISDDNVAQLLFTTSEYLDEYSSRLASMGDLDGDGKMDFILYATKRHYQTDEDQKEEYIHKAWLLFLSSEAEEGDLVKHVATQVVRIPIEENNDYN